MNREEKIALDFITVYRKYKERRFQSVESGKGDEGESINNPYRSKRKRLNKIARKA
jgi:hypothetical protein